ncbi:MAG TPA: hypothetical protein VNB94_08265 [Mycobacteriales bacterium]|nr:hypothetical protein [Mycobacteriales bacterium]
MGSKSSSARRWLAAFGTAAMVGGMPTAWSASAPSSRLYGRDPGRPGCAEGLLHPTAGSREGACFSLAQPVSDASAAAGYPLLHEFTYNKRLARFAPHGRVHVRVTVGHLQDIAGAGATTVDVTLLSRRRDQSTVTLGTASASGLVSPAGTDEFDLSVPVTTAVRGKPLDSLVLRVEIRGVAVPHAYVHLNGRTWLDHAARP